MYKITFIIFFILGMCAEPFMPKDAHVDVPDSPPRAIPVVEQVADDEGKCLTFQKFLNVDGTLVEGLQKIVCK